MWVNHDEFGWHNGTLTREIQTGPVCCLCEKNASKAVERHIVETPNCFRSIHNLDL